jgi:hypothetical protein
VRYHTVQLLTALSATNAHQLQAWLEGGLDTTFHSFDIFGYFCAATKHGLTVQLMTASRSM